MIFIEAGGALRLTRIEHRRAQGGYYSIDGYALRDGLEAALPNA